MGYFVAFDAMRKVRKKHKNCRLDSVMVHAAGQHITGPFSADFLADIIDLPVPDVRKILSSSTYFRSSDNETFCKRERLSGLYGDSMRSLDNGKLIPANFMDSEKKDVLIRDPLVDYFMAVVKKFGDILTLLEMGIQMAIYEQGQVSTFDGVIERIQLDDHELVQSRLDNLVSNQMLSVSEKNNVTYYRYTAKASDIFNIIFKARAGS